MSDAASDLTAALGGRYRVERELGAGGMATVYLADDIRHSRRVAIKVLRADLAAALGAERFLRETTTTASLRHPHIVPLYDSGSGDGTLYYVMPFVEGESLRDAVRLVYRACASGVVGGRSPSVSIDDYGCRALDGEPTASQFFR